ncbi:MAG: DUF2281 domain-containing protein [Treponema sp.]|nr:DUF2281 domain-containing protein [Treponema sp.]
MAHGLQANNAELFSRISKLPPQYLGEVFDFVGYLQHKVQQNNAIEQKEPAKVPVFGYSKGQYNITEAFFEPLEDFKDYM